MDEIKRVPIKSRNLSLAYESADGSGKIKIENDIERAYAEERQKAIAATYNDLTKNNRINSLGIWESARTPNSFNVNAQQALDPFMKLKADENVTFFDIEAIGTPEHMRKNKGIDLFSITELSFGGTQFNGDDFVKSKGAIVSMAVAPGKHEYARLKQQINQLKKNPMMAVSQDMHRTLLDLAKYSDGNKFKSVTHNGQAYMSLLGHSRVPSAGTAFTRNTIDEIELGLNNLYSKGTKLEDALSIFQSHIKSTNSKLGGYNIHHYDLPAIIGAAGNSSTKKFFSNAAKDSLDFYHGYSAAVKDPYSLTGSSLRQEHIHQALIAKGGINPKQSSYLYHLAKDDIQANIEIAGFTHRKIKSFIQDAKKSPADYALTPSSLKTETLKAGQELFSYQSGYFNKDKHRYNLVGTVEDGKMKPRWANLNTSLPSNESFTINEFLKDVTLPGTDKKGYGVRLDSKDMKGKSLLLMSETQEELAQQIHGAFMPMDDAVSKGLRDLKVKHDASFREYERMFDRGGWKKMNEYYNYLDKAGDVGKDFDWKNHVTNNGGTEELAIKFPHMVERLKAEESVWKNVADQLGKSQLSDDQKSIALRHIKNKFDSLGDNKTEVTAAGNKFFNFTFGKDDEMVFNGKNTEQIKNAFRSHIRGGRRGDRIGDPEKSYKLARIDELSDMVINNFGFSADGEEAKKVRAIAEGMRTEVYAGNKIETALTSMSNFVRDHVETRGKSSFVREVTNEVTSKRRSAITELTKDLPDVIQDSIQHAQSYSKAKDALTGNSELKKFLKEQDGYIQKLFAKNFGAQGMNSRENIERASSMAAKYEELVGKIMSAYSNDFNTQIRFTEDKNPLLVLADKKSGMDLSEVKTYEELVRNPKLATIELPRFDEDLKVRYGSNRKASVIRSGIGKKGAYHSTTVTDALNMILDYSGKAKELSELAQDTGGKNHFIQIRQGLRYRVGKQVDPVPTDANRKLHFDDREMFEMKTAIGAEVRSSKWDITGYAEAWYRANSKRLGFSSSADKVADRAKEQGISFYEAMGQRAKGLATSGGLLEFANETSQLKGSMFGINNRSAGKGFVGTANTDARTYMALGNYYSDSVENPHKTVNYRKVEKEYAERALTKVGKNQSFRTNNSFISSSAFKALDDAKEIRGITMQTGYMTDEEIALKLKDANKVSEYKVMIDKAQRKNQITPAEAKQMKKALDMGMLSTSEGLAFMDHNLMKAFDGMDEVRINMNADKVLFDNSIEAAIEKEAKKQGLGDGLWKEKGITFDKPVDIDVSKMTGKDGTLTLGKFWNNNIESAVVDEKRFRKGDKVSVLGFSADDITSKSLVLGRKRKTGQGFKAVTEGGFRATMTPMLGEIMSDLYGVEGVEQVISHLGEKKGSTDLPSLIRGYDTQIRQQFSGAVTKSKKIKGYNSEEAALSAFYKDVEEMIGIKTTNENGQYVVDSNFGLDGKQLKYEDRNKLSSKWMNELGLDREVFADITMAHDVWNRQGGIDRGKITVKEIDMLERSYTRTGLYAPGKSSAHATFMRDMVYGSETTPEIKAQQKVFNEMVKVAGNYENGWTPKAGDAVIDYTSDGMGVMTDVNAQMKDGVLHISKDSFESIPQKSGHNQTFTVGDYNKSIINAGAMEFNLESGGKGKKLQEHLLNTKGTAYMKLPEFAANQYIPLLDVNSMKLPSDVNFVEKTEFLDTLKGHYANIGRKTEEYNNLFVTDTFSESKVAERRGLLQKEINQEVSNLVTTLGDSTSKDGMAKIMARRLPMSSQYQFGGVNPALAYQKDGDKWVNNGLAKEGEIYMNQKDVRNLIGDKAENIAKSWNVDTTKIDGDMTDYVMKNWNKYDTYSTSIRYPSIDVGTTQAMKLKLSDAVGEGQVVGLRGMAERISGDFDGDNLAVFLTHYGIDDEKQRKAVLGDISNLHNFDKAKNELAADVIMNKMEKDFRASVAKGSGLDTGHKDVIAASEAFFSNGNTENLTLGDLHGAQAQETIRKSLESTGVYDDWGTVKNGNFGLGEAEHEKSILARATSSTIGSVDNTRMRMSAAFMTMAETKYKLFNKAEGAMKYSQQDYIQETAMVDEFLREYSQKAISAKKTEGSAETAEDVMGGLYKMIDKINNPSNGLDYDLAAAELVDQRGLFKSSPFLEIGKGEVYKGSNHDFVKKSLQILGGAEETYAEMGIKGYRESSLLVAASQGIGFHNFSHMVKTGEHIPGMDAVTEISNIAKEYGNERMAKHQEFFEGSIKRIHERRFANVEDRLDDAVSSVEIMGSRKPVEPTIMSNEAMPIHRTMRDQMNDSFADLATAGKKAFGGSAASLAGVGALGFGALWATNALMKGAPTPEGLQEMAPVSPETLGAPTARVTPQQNGEYINISVNAKAAQRMSHNDLAAMLNNEIMAMSNVKMNTSVNVNDNSQNIDGKWLEGAVANAMNKGYAY